MSVVAVGLLGIIRLATAGKFTLNHIAGSPDIAATEIAGLHPGDRPGEFQATNLDGESVTRRTLYGSRWAVLITKTGCPPCSRIFDEIAAVESRKLTPRILVAVDDADIVLPAHRRSGATFIMDTNGSLASAFKSFGVPIAFLLDMHGEILRVVILASLQDVLALELETGSLDSRSTTTV